MRKWSQGLFSKGLQASHLHRTEEQAGDALPLRAELFSRDQMEQHGKNLAAVHHLASKQASDQLLKRLADNERVLVGVCELLTSAITADRRIAPAGEWLLDNFYLIEEQIRTAQRHLPKGYSRELPRLQDGPSAGLPRVYDIALETVAHGDGRVDLETLSSFIAAYQTVTPLKLSELWAIPIMLRLALIENLRRVGARLAADRLKRNHADRWADQMTEVAERDPKSLILVIADMARSNPPMAGSFIAEFSRRLQGQSAALALPLTWIEQWLAESGLTIELCVQSENQQQAADQVSIGNSIGSLRALGALDWRDFVEAMSQVEQALREDPAGVYAGMDFSTRDRYRHVVERLARRSKLSETEIAHAALHLALKARASSSDTRSAHIGFFLVDLGLRQLEDAVALRPTWAVRWQRGRHRCPLLLYVGSILLITLAVTGAALRSATIDHLHGLALALLGLFVVPAASHLAVAMVNWLTTELASPALLPRMDFSSGIPPGCRSLVVVPTMLADASGVDSLLEALEVRFLGNRDSHLHFALLTDLRDAATEVTDNDAALVEQAQHGIAALNHKYPASTGDTFFLLHRARRWNPQERVWMGRERKRGKLADLNRLLRGDPSQFSVIGGDIAVLASVKYVITLDTDTQLTRDSARQFVATMAHPLNQPYYDPDKERVTRGYGILQPGIAANLPSGTQSRYARLRGSEPGLDPYTHAVSDVYQDLFEEGSFIGKGIYDVDGFERALQGRLPDNRILSHDLLEGCYARSGLLTDVQLYEDYPTTYSADVSRRHRWIRGDWQVARWLLPRVPDQTGKLRHNPISALSRWKIFDNLRRSLVPAALVLLFLFIWTSLTPAWVGTLAVLALLLLPPLGASLAHALRKPDDMLLGAHLAAAARATASQLSDTLFSLACLPDEACFSLDAILRTTGRMLFTHRRLLEWTPSHEGNRAAHQSLGATFQSMWTGPVIGMATFILLAMARPEALAAAIPLLATWTASPAIAWWLSRPRQRGQAKLSAGQLRFLRILARKTWAFFDSFVGPADHWLPPDNVQEQPIAVIAHRTSPTNIGLALLSNLAAYDLGYLTTGRLLERTAQTFATLDLLERFEGHFYNWYDTETLKPLPPTYVSTVDSGNLAGHLLVLRSGLLALIEDDLFLEQRWLEGLKDTLHLWRATASDSDRASLNALAAQIEAVATSPDRASLRALCRSVEGIAAAPVLVPTSDPGRPSAARAWAEAMTVQCREALEELRHFVPWAFLPPPPPSLADVGELDRTPTLRELARSATDLLPALTLRSAAAPADERAWFSTVGPLLETAASQARARIQEIERLAGLCEVFANMTYDFLYDRARRLLTIGYNVSERRRDSSDYDLLASEARLSSFVAIAQGQLPQESWFALGRLLAASGGEPLLLSWSGSMFEYLMPALVMPTYEQTLLDQTCKVAVQRQIEYGQKRGVPWGISESGYNAFDAHLNYQYRAFGVPGLGLKRGLGDDLVIAPYASALALMVAPEEACANLQRLANAGLEGRYGLYEAVDYTPARLPRGQTSVVVRSFMAHHLGMSLLALDFLLCHRPMQMRFESNSLFQATTLLLQERVPKRTAFALPTTSFSGVRPEGSGTELSLRVLTSPHTPVPEVQLLSNGHYHVMVTNAGGGYSRWNDLAITRWREDATCDDWGTFCYLRDVDSGAVWSGAHQPTLQPSARYEAIFSEGRAEFRRRDHDIDVHTEIAVSPEDDVEIRRITLTNRSRTRRRVEITSYAEVVIAPAAADAAHPAFSNLFVQTEIVLARQAILCSRRPRSIDEATPWMGHLMVVHGADADAPSFETDRMRFLGRGRTAADPLAMQTSGSLSGSQGSVLDPIVAIRYRIALDPEQSATVNIVTGMSESRAGCLGLIEKYQDRRLADRVFDLAWTHSQVVLRQINATEADAQLYCHLASSIIHANGSLRASPSVLIKNRRGQSGLWGYAISGDLPIVLLQIADAANIELVRQLVQAHAYWRLKGLAVDLVIWNEDHAGYRQLLHEQIMGLIAAGSESTLAHGMGEIFVRPVEQISNEDRVLVQTVSRAIVSDSRGTLADQINRRPNGDTMVPRLVPSRAHQPEPALITVPDHTSLHFWNGLGGFSADGSEYVIAPGAAEATPAPWVNVLANPQFGTVVSESGGGYTWNENAHECRLTPWYNDPVSDISGEAFYIRDEETGHFWSPTPLPCPGASPYVTRHGFGSSVFEHLEDGIQSELTVFVAKTAAVKFWVLKLRNQSARPRRLSLTGYLEWVLGELRAKSLMHVFTELDPVSGAVLARNPYSAEFAARVAFFAVSDASHTTTGDRTEFIGRNRTLRNPAALRRVALSGRLGAGLDPCTALQVQLELAGGQQKEIVFTLGMGQNTDDARALVGRFRGVAAARSELTAVQESWRELLGVVQVETPDTSLNFLANGWLLYQTLSCRLWGRSGFYQSGGAFGFRDQLQDVMALVHAGPQFTRAQLMLCAARQFKEGDVQHWWHPPAGRGVRTHCSDDYLWLPLVTCRYVQTTGDHAVLNETLRFLEGRPVHPDEDSYYDLPLRSEESTNLYQHCVRAIEHGLRMGVHGLPLMGGGDWNDGMNLVGQHGQGESVWLAFFLFDVLLQFAGLADTHNDPAFAEHCRSEAAQLRQNIATHAWDGDWYRRAYFDDGTPLGASINPECQMDSIAQSWAVLSGAADPERARLAMEAVSQRLVRRDHRLVQLLDPPFDTSPLNPGYIKGYVPGVRENGGQYTHAAIWAIMAFAARGDHRRAWELFDIINPIGHASTAEALATYKVEPYVAAADVYALAPHTGRGGWTWYTGSAGWMYQLILESLLGLQREESSLHFAPCLPAAWTQVTIRYRFGRSLYNIVLHQREGADGLTRVTVDGTERTDGVIPLHDDGQEHAVEVLLRHNDS